MSEKSIFILTTRSTRIRAQDIKKVIFWKFERILDRSHKLFVYHPSSYRDLENLCRETLISVEYVEFIHRRMEIVHFD